MDYKVEKDWIHNGLRCVVILSTTLGHRCGYVGVPKDNPLFEKDYREIDFLIEVHGGLTYSGGGNESKYPVKSDLWWFGYDCAHSGDGKDLLNCKPEVLKLEIKFPTGGVVRTLDYCITECERMAEQINKIEVQKVLSME